MKLSLGSIFKVSLRYVYKRGNTYYYQRKIPLDLVDRYGGKALIKVNLKTSDLKQVAKQVAVLNRQHESTWISLRHNPNMSPQSVRESAIKLLAQFGLQPHFPQNGLPPISRTHHLSTLQIFKLYRADIADGRMPAFWVVKPFDVIEDIGA